MPDDCVPHLRRPAPAGGPSRVPQHLVDDTRIGLRVTELYVHGLLERFELARLDARILDRLPAGPLEQVLSDLAALEESAARALEYLDPELAGMARVVRTLFRRGSAAGPEAGAE